MSRTWFIDTAARRTRADKSFTKRTLEKQKYKAEKKEKS
jgi:hypothetical protein